MCTRNKSFAPGYRTCGSAVPCRSKPAGCRAAGSNRGGTWITSSAQALRWHVSSVNIKSSAIPPEWKKAFDEFQKKMGYRFILRRLEYPPVVLAGTMQPVHMWWLNAGVAPVYRQYDLAMELRSAGGSAEIRLPVDVRKWLPGDAVFDGTIYIPESLKPGSYRLRVALLDPRTGQPAIKLAIEGLATRRLVRPCAHRSAVKLARFSRGGFGGRAFCPSSFCPVAVVVQFDVEAALRRHMAR